MASNKTTLDPVLLCNDLGSDPTHNTRAIHSSGHAVVSVKEAVGTARSNNFMGLICKQRLLVRL
jgi:hypothetical protein